MNEGTKVNLKGDEPVLKLIGFIPNKKAQNGNGLFEIDYLIKICPVNEEIVKKLICKGIPLNIKEASVWAASIGCPADVNERSNWEDLRFEERVKQIELRLRATKIKSFTNFL